MIISPRPPEGQAVLLAGQAHSGSVHDGHELLDVRGQQTVEQLLVPVLQRHQQDVPETESETKHFNELQHLLQVKEVLPVLLLVKNCSNFWRLKRWNPLMCTNNFISNMLRRGSK